MTSASFLNKQLLACKMRVIISGPGYRDISDDILPFGYNVLQMQIMNTNGREDVRTYLLWRWNFFLHSTHKLDSVEKWWINSTK